MSQATSIDNQESHNELQALLDAVVVENELLIISTSALRQELDEHRAVLKCMERVFQGFRNAFTTLANHTSADYECLELADGKEWFRQELRRNAEKHKQTVLSPLLGPQQQQQRGRNSLVALTETIAFSSPRDSQPPPLPPSQTIQDHEAAEFLFSQQPRKRWDYVEATERSLVELVDGIFEDFQQFAVHEMTREK